MCDFCDELQRKIDQHTRVLSQSLDDLSKQRIGDALKEMQARLRAMHR